MFRLLVRKNLWFFNRSRNDKGKPLDHKAMQRLLQRASSMGSRTASVWPSMIGERH
jgi:hypothetical protein